MKMKKKRRGRWDDDANNAREMRYYSSVIVVCAMQCNVMTVCLCVFCDYERVCVRQYDSMKMRGWGGVGLFSPFFSKCSLLSRKRGSRRERERLLWLSWIEMMLLLLLMINFHHHFSSYPHNNNNTNHIISSRRRSSSSSLLSWSSSHHHITHFTMHSLSIISSLPVSLSLCCI